MAQFFPYTSLVVLLIFADKLSKGRPVNQIMIYSGIGILALILGIFSSGMISVFAFIAVGLFCSTLWPCIFTLGIAGLKEKTNTGSSLLIMMIMGGGFISTFQGALAHDDLLGIQHSYWVGVLCFIYLFFFAFIVNKKLKEQGVDLNTSMDPLGH